MPRFVINFLDDYSDESLLEEIRRVAAKNTDTRLSIRSFERISQRVSASTVRRRFGGWENALIKAGLAHLYGGRTVSAKMRERPGRRLTKDDLIAEMQRVHRHVGKGFLTVSDFNIHSETSVAAVSRRFGSWTNALKEAGIPRSENANRNWSNEECFENLARVWSHFGRRPAYSEMSASPSTINGRAYETRWGTWRRALRAFVTWANSESESSAATLPLVTAIDTEVKPVLFRRGQEDRRQVGPQLRFRVFQRDRFRCVACGRSPASDLNIILHADHVVPVALGGKTAIENLQTLCQGCNLGKGKLPG